MRAGRALLALAAALSVLVLLVSSYGALLAWRVTSQVSVTDLRDSSDAPDRPTAEPGGPAASAQLSDPDTALPGTDISAGRPLNVLLVGSDSRAGQVNSQYGSVASFGQPRADVTMLAHLSADRSWGYLISVPRDLVVNIPTSRRACGGVGFDEHTRFNESLSRGGVPCVVATLESVLPGLRIDHAVVVDFEGFISVVDALGGLSVCLKTPIRDMSASVSLPAGSQTLSGVEALGLVRARKSLADGSDIARTERQQLVAKAFAQQVSRSKSLADAPALYEAALSLAPHLTVDRGLADAWSLVNLARAGLSSFDGAFFSRTLPWLPDPAAPGQTVVLNPEGWGKLKDSFVDDLRPVRPARAAERYSNPNEVFCS